MIDVDNGADGDAQPARVDGDEEDNDVELAEFAAELFSISFLPLLSFVFVQIFFC
jgi:hypothetical protein